MKWIVIRYAENIGPAVAGSAGPVPTALLINEIKWERLWCSYVIHCIMYPDWSVHCSLSFFAEFCTDTCSSILYLCRHHVLLQVHGGQQLVQGACEGLHRRAEGEILWPWLGLLSWDPGLLSCDHGLLPCDHGLLSFEIFLLSCDHDLVCCHVKCFCCHVTMVCCHVKCFCCHVTMVCCHVICMACCRVILAISSRRYTHVHVCMHSATMASLSCDQSFHCHMTHSSGVGGVCGLWKQRGSRGSQTQETSYSRPLQLASSGWTCSGIHVQVNQYFIIIIFTLIHEATLLLTTK